MNSPKIEQQVKELIEKKQYDEAKELLKSSYNLTEEQAIAFIQKLEKSSGSPAQKPKAGFGTKIKKGCGCMTIFFLVIAAWGMYGLYKQYSDDVLVKGLVVDYYTEESTNSDGKLETLYSPIVIYSYANKDYRDTINNMQLAPEYELNTTVDLYIDPSQPQWVTDNSFWGAATMYIPFLVLAILSFLGYRYIGAIKIKLNPLDKAAEKLKEAEAKYKAAEDNPNITDKEAAANIKVALGESFTEVEKPKMMTPKMAFVTALIFLLAGFGLMYLGHRAQLRGERMAAGDTVIGQVLNERRETSQNKTTGYHYVITYEYNGVSQEYETTTRFSNYSTGDQVELKINPADPKEVAINMEEDLYGRRHYSFILILLGIGGFLIYLGIYLIKLKKSGKQDL